MRNILSSSPGSVNYRRRLGDGTTALMAAAFHGDLDAVRYLLSVGATPCSVDGGGKTAALFAGMRGHRECFAELQRVVDEESTSSTRGRAGGGHDEFVYDLYYFEPSSSNAKANDGRRTASGEQRNHERTVGKVDEVDQVSVRQPTAITGSHLGVAVRLFNSGSRAAKVFSIPSSAVSLTR